MFHNNFPYNKGVENEFLRLEPTKKSKTYYKNYTKYWKIPNQDPWVCTNAKPSSYETSFVQLQTQIIFKNKLCIVKKFDR